MRSPTPTTALAAALHLLLGASLQLGTALGMQPASTSTSLTLAIPASAPLSNPNALAPSTHATLTTLGDANTITTAARRSAPLSVDNAFVFHNVTPGSYLADVHCGAYGFAPLRVDVLLPAKKAAAAADNAADGGLDVRVWETYRGHEWGNLGEEVRAAEGTGTGSGAGAAGGKVFAVRCLGKKVFFQERGSFNVLSILKNPMILLGLVSMAIFIGMPKLIENMDPEMRAEFEENQKNNPVSGLLGGGAQQGANPMGNFDMAAFLAGSNAKTEGTSNGESNSGGKKKR